MTKEEYLAKECIKASIKNTLLSETSPQEEQYIREAMEIDQKLNNKLTNFLREFIRASVEKRKYMLLLAEKAYGESDDKYETEALKFIRDLCVAVDIRDGECRGA